MTTQATGGLDHPWSMFYLGHMPKFTPTKGAARELRVSVRTIHRWVEAGEITPIDKLEGLRGAYLFDEAEVQRVKAKREQVAA